MLRYKQLHIQSDNIKHNQQAVNEASPVSTFTQLWKNFPKGDKIVKKCYNAQDDGIQTPFDDYCAIRLSESFNRSGVNIGGLGGKRCWSHKEGLKHFLLAEELANSLKRNPPKVFSNAIEVPPATFQKVLKKTGVIFFKDYWTRGKETFENRSGDHIDLWNKDRLTGRPMWLRELYELFSPSVSDLNKSKKVWFWKVN